MAQCDLGFEHEGDMPAAEPVVVDTGPNENSVQIAKIEAAASVKREEAYAESERVRADAELVALRAENELLRQGQTPAVVVVETDDEPETDPEPVIEPDENEPPENDGNPVPSEPKVKKKPGWFDAYG
jgi:hypothetical protein